MVHSFRFDKFNIVIDVNSGAIHILSDIAFDVLSNINGAFFDFSKDLVIRKLSEKYNKKEVEEAYDELLTLYNNELLFSKDALADFAKNLNTESPIKALCLNVAHDCNLKCSYCFVSKGDFSCNQELMTFETAKNSIDFLIQNSGTRHNLEVDFFGGEPLMNFDVVKKTVEYGRKLEKKYNKNFRFTFTTNGLLLNDDIIDFLNREMVNVVLSLDGRKKVNDSFRKTQTGTGSYDIIVPKFKKFVQKRGDKEYYIRGTFTRNNLDFSKDILHMKDLGFDQLSMEPVVSDESDDYAIRKSDLNKIFDEYEILAKEIIKIKKSGEKINFFHFNLDLNRGACATKRLKGCGVGNEYLVITPNGDIFPCHQFVGKDEFKMGNINSKTFDKKIKEKFLKTNIYHKEDCKKCWAKLFCSGGCSANNYNFCGDIMKPYKISCEILKKRLECALGVKVALAS